MAAGKDESGDEQTKSPKGKMGVRAKGDRDRSLVVSSPYAERLAERRCYECHPTSRNTLHT